MKKRSITILFCIIGVSLMGQSQQQSSKGFVMDKIIKTDEEWQACLTPEQYQVLREKGTERGLDGQHFLMR